MVGEFGWTSKDAVAIPNTPEARRQSYEKEGNGPNRKQNERCNVDYSACDVLCAAIECAGQPASVRSGSFLAQTSAEYVGNGFGGRGVHGCSRPCVHR